MNKYRKMKVVFVLFSLLSFSFCDDITCVGTDYDTAADCDGVYEEGVECKENDGQTACEKGDGALDCLKLIPASPKTCGSYEYDTDKFCIVNVNPAKPCGFITCAVIPYVDGSECVGEYEEGVECEDDSSTACKKGDGALDCLELIPVSPKTCVSYEYDTGEFCIVNPNSATLAGQPCALPEVCEDVVITSPDTCGTHYEGGVACADNPADGATTDCVKPTTPAETPCAGLDITAPDTCAAHSEGGVACAENTAADATTDCVKPTTPPVEDDDGAFSVFASTFIIVLIYVLNFVL
jgi:hypothetical protein